MDAGGGRNRGGRFGSGVTIDTTRGGGRFGNSMAINALSSTTPIDAVQSSFSVGIDNSMTANFSDMGDDFNTSATNGDHPMTPFARANVSSMRKVPYLSKAKSSFDAKPLPTCRVCSKQFESFDELKKHIRLENHHNDASANATSGNVDGSMLSTSAVPLINSRLRERPSSPRRKSSPGTAMSGKDTALLNMKEKLRMSMLKQGAANKKKASQTTAGVVDNSALQISAVGADNDDDIQDMEDDDDALIFDDNDYQAIADEEDRNPIDNNVDDSRNLNQEYYEADREKSQGNYQTNIIIQQPTVILNHPEVIERSNSALMTDSVLGADDTNSSMIGTCTDMCPTDERESRMELQLLEPFEKEHPDIPGSFKDLMIKEFKRSSADYLLLIPHRIRTPATLLKTIRYIEDNIMEKDKQGVDPRFGCVPPSITVYLFIWDRYRMIAKDFILQEFAICVDEVYMECHERMARWFILMDHTMQRDDKFNDGHLQQNRESTNKLFKTLLECYKDTKLAHVPMPNKAEFVAYYLLEQMGNGGEVAKLMRQLSFDVRSSEKVKFAAEVWAAWKMKDYSRFFRLLQKADACQASLMHRYVGDIRLAGIKTMVRSYFFKGSSSYYPMHDLINLFMFEDLNDALAFFRHCGIAVEDVLLSSDDTEETLCAIFLDQRIQDLLPRDKNGHPILPKASHMLQGIDSKYVHHSLGEVCRGALSAIRLFDDSKVISTARYAQLCPQSTITRAPAKAEPENFPLKPIAAAKQSAPKPSAAALAMLNSALGEVATTKMLELKEPIKQKVDLGSLISLPPTTKEAAPPDPQVTIESMGPKATTPFQFASSLQTKHIAEIAQVAQKLTPIGTNNLSATPSPKDATETFKHAQYASPVDTSMQQAVPAAQQEGADEEEQRRKRDDAIARQREQELLKERQRLEAERLERLKEETLIPLLHITQKHLKKGSAKKAFVTWYQLALFRKKGHLKSVTHMFFGNWLRLLRNRQMRSRQTIFDLQKINISRPDSIQAASKADSTLAISSIEGRVAMVLPLLGCSPCNFTPSVIVAPPLFRAQSGAVREELGFLDTHIVDASSKSGPLWQGDLFWKLAVLSDAQVEGHYHSDDNMLTSAVRALLTSHVAIGKTGGVIGLWRDLIQILLPRHASVVKTVHSSVIDICNSSRQTEMELKGTQAALVIVTLRGGLKRVAMNALKTFINNGLPVVLIVGVGMNGEGESVTWEELPADLRGHDAVLELILSISTELGCSLVNNGFISKVFAVQIKQLTPKSNPNHLAEEVQGIATACTSLMSAILSTLATTCPSFPLIHRVNIYELLDRGLSEAIFKPVSRRRSNDLMLEMLDDLENFNARLDDLLTVLVRTEAAGDIFPAPEFSKDYFSFNERPNSVLFVEGALFQETTDILGSNYLPVCWMQATNIATARSVINSIKMPLTVFRQSYGSSAEFVPDILAGLQSCGWNISQHDCDYFKSSMANLIEGDNYLWRKVFKIIVEKRIQVLEEKNRFSFLYLLFKCDIFTRAPSIAMSASIDQLYSVSNAIIEKNERSLYKRSFSLLNTSCNHSIPGVETNDKRLRSDDSWIFEQENRDFLDQEIKFISEISEEEMLQNFIENALEGGLQIRPSGEKKKKHDESVESNINSLLSKCRNERTNLKYSLKY